MKCWWWAYPGTHCSIRALWVILRELICLKYTYKYNMNNVQGASSIVSWSENILMHTSSPDYIQMMSDKKKKVVLLQKWIYGNFLYIQFFFYFSYYYYFFFLVLFENVRYFRYSCTEIRDDKKKHKQNSLQSKIRFKRVLLDSKFIDFFFVAFEKLIIIIIMVIYIIILFLL